MTSDIDSSDIDRLCAIIGYRFSDEALLLQALSHRGKGSLNYERLEFLGDGALNFVVAAELYHRKPDLAEGDLSRMRARLVRGATLTEIARENSLGQFLQLAEGELKSGAHERDSILADLVESLIGAVYVDSGFDEAAALVKRLLAARLENLPEADTLKDPKTRLQELLQSQAMPLPVYSLVESTGKPHEQQLTMKCRLEGLDLETTATATSRRKAEQAAAVKILDHPKLSALVGS